MKINGVSRAHSLRNFFKFPMNLGIFPDISVESSLLENIRIAYQPEEDEKYQDHESKIIIEDLIALSGTKTYISVMLLMFTIVSGSVPEKLLQERRLEMMQIDSEPKFYFRKLDFKIHTVYLNSSNFRGFEEEVRA